MGALWHYTTILARALTNGGHLKGLDWRMKIQSTTTRGNTNGSTGRSNNETVLKMLVPVTASSLIMMVMNEADADTKQLCYAVAQS